MFVEYWILYQSCNFESFIHPHLTGIVALYRVHERMAPRRMPESAGVSTLSTAFEKIAMSAPVPLGSRFDGLCRASERRTRARSGLRDRDRGARREYFRGLEEPERAGAEQNPKSLTSKQLSPEVWVDGSLQAFSLEG